MGATCMKQSTKKPSNNGRARALGVWIQPQQLVLESPLLQNLPSPGTPLCLIESLPDLSTPQFHKKRLVLVLSMQRHFAQELEKRGYPVHYYSLNDEATARFAREGKEACLRDFIQRNRLGRLRVMEAEDFGEDRFLQSLEQKLDVEVEILESDRFLVHRKRFEDWFGSVEENGVESFYRHRRRETGLLMEDGQPLGGRWNYDSDNRVAPAGNMKVPPPVAFEPDTLTRDTMRLVDRLFGKHPGEVEGFNLPVTRNQVLQWFEDFVEKRLRLFGMYQDAMLENSAVLYHSFLSPYLNHGLIAPGEVLEGIARAYEEGDIPINSAEGFLRQILGWREYIHGTYWMKMPEMADRNFFDSDRPLPEFFTKGESRLKCIQCVLNQTDRLAYAHHIQRLMVIGNFALLVGAEPKKVVRWFRERYIDSTEWATLPNVMGVALYADGGDLGAKPYVASAHYIQKMTDYCQGCHYRGKKRLGERACPLNYLYWNFVGTHQDRLRGNPRMQNAIQMFRAKSEAERKLVTKSSEEFLGKLEERGTDVPPPRKAGKSRALKAVG